MPQGHEVTLADPDCYVCHKSCHQVCVACQRKTCSDHRGAGKNDYQNARGQEGYACLDCIEQGKVTRKGVFADLQRISVAAERMGKTADQIRDTLATLDVKLLPVVMAAVDARLETIQRTMVEPSVLLVVEKAEVLVKASLAETTRQLEVNANMLAGKSEELVNSALTKTGQQLGEQTDKLAKAIDDRIDKLTEAVERLNPNKLMWQAGLVFGLVNVATVIAAAWIAKHM